LLKQARVARQGPEELVKDRRLFVDRRALLKISLGKGNSFNKEGFRGRMTDEG
jgi:hypothetical protein